MSEFMITAQVTEARRTLERLKTNMRQAIKGKDDVIGAVLQHIRDSLQENVRSARAETTDPLERLRRLLMRHLAMVRDNVALPAHRLLGRRLCRAAGSPGTHVRRHSRVPRRRGRDRPAGTDRWPDPA